MDYYSYAPLLKLDQPLVLCGIPGAEVGPGKRRGRSALHRSRLTDGRGDVLCESRDGWKVEERRRGQLHVEQLAQLPHELRAGEGVKPQLHQWFILVDGALFEAERLSNRIHHFRRY